MRVQIVDPSAFTPPYDHSLCAALARAGADVELVTSRFGYGEVTASAGYRRREAFYRRQPGSPGSARRRAAKLALHVPDMLSLRRRARLAADIVHFQWFDVPWVDRWLIPEAPTVLTAHDLLPREARFGQARAQRRLLEAVDAVIVHSQYGRAQLVERLGIDAARVHVVPHGAFEHLTRVPPASLPTELTDGAASGRPVVLFFGLLRPYKGIETLLEAWRGIADAELWVVGRPRMPLAPLLARAPAGVRFVPRFVPDAEMAAVFRRADVVVLPYTRTERFDQSGVLAAALAFGLPTVLTRIGGFPELAATGAARLVAPDDPPALRAALVELLTEPDTRGRLAAAARTAAAGPFSWDTAAELTMGVYRHVLDADRAIGPARAGGQSPS